jgi:hypothetical protein
MKIHNSLTLSRITEAVEDAQASLSNPGFCLACGEEADGCEPDMEKGSCESCGEDAVYGAEQLLIILA